MEAGGERSLGGAMSAAICSTSFLESLMMLFPAA
jgi:hypothetical protein